MISYDEWVRVCIAEIMATAPEDLEQTVLNINREHLLLFGGQQPPNDLTGVITIPELQAARRMMLAFDDVPTPKPKAPHPYAGEQWRKRNRNGRT